MSNKSTVSLTEGTIWKQILTFTYPVLLSNLFNEVYNLTNSMICGNYISTEALGAVSACSSIMNIFTYLFWGLGTGAGIIIARYYGAKKKDDLKRAVETVVVSSIIFGLSFTIIAEVLTPFLLRIGKVPSDIYSEANIYFRTYVIGFIFNIMYSMVFFVLRGIGDSKHPLYYQIASCFVNIGLGMFFVKVCNMEIAGVALATILSQLMVDVLSMRLLLKMDEFKFSIKELHLDLSICQEILSLGIPAAVQNMLIGLSTMLVQTYTNMFTTEAIAGIGVGQKVANWSQMPTQAFATVMTSFVGQNMGAEKYDRVKDGVKWTVYLCLIVNTILSIIIFLFAEPFISLFDSDPMVIHYGTEMTRYMVFSYVPLSLSHIYNAACRGAGNMRFPLYIAVITQCIFRYIFVFIGFKFTFDIRLIYLSGSLCFALAGILATLYYNFGKFTKEYKMR